jgi:hypothetical protein
MEIELVGLDVALEIKAEIAAKDLIGAEREKAAAIGID